VINTKPISPTPVWRLRVGYALSGLVILFLLMDAAMKLMRLPIVLETTVQLGWPSDSAMPLGVLLLVCTLLYGWPRTSALGAVLLTGYLGGAIATHARIGSPLYSHTLFGVYLGVLSWVGLYLRDPRVSALVTPDRGQLS
jgi:DoxX-like family